VALTFVGEVVELTSFALRRFRLASCRHDRPPTSLTCALNVVVVCRRYTIKLRLLSIVVSTTSRDRRLDRCVARHRAPLQRLLYDTSNHFNYQLTSKQQSWRWRSR